MREENLVEQLSLLEKAAIARNPNALKALEYLQGVIDRKKRKDTTNDKD